MEVVSRIRKLPDDQKKNKIKGRISFFFVELRNFFVLGMADFIFTGCYSYITLCVNPFNHSFFYLSPFSKSYPGVFFVCFCSTVSCGRERKPYVVKQKVRDLSHPPPEKIFSILGNGKCLGLKNYCVNCLTVLSLFLSPSNWF